MTQDLRLLMQTILDPQLGRRIAREHDPHAAPYDGLFGRILVADWLFRLRLLREVEILDIVRRFARPLDTFMTSLAVSVGLGETKLDTATLTLCDARFITTSLLTDVFYEVTSGEDVKELPEPATTLMTCNLVALYLKARRRIDGMKGATDGSTSADARPGDAGGSRQADPL